MMNIIKHAMQQTGDQVNAQKVNELKQKYESNEWVIALCGHFSAGKSSLVNALCGEAILPSSPIPTSANTVSIRYGERKQAYVTKVQPLQRVQVELEHLEAYCKDGEGIETVNITFPAKLLQMDGLVLVDTPGMDSTDERHREQTLGALHLADVIFYITDYNHVQSEFNLSFAKRMKQIGKPFYLIINQIDKHRDEEIAYETFLERVKHSFMDWGADPDGILTLSLKEHEHRYNEWPRLLWLIRSLHSVRGQLCEMGIKKALLQCIEDHGEWRQKTWEDKHPAFVERMGTMSFSDAKIKAEQYKQAMEETLSKPEQIVQNMKDEVNKLLENANIIPALTRDKVLRYLESTKRGFKASWWHNRSKTEKVIEERANDLLTDLNENVETQIVTHLIEIVSGISAIANDTHQPARDWSFVINREQIDSLIQPGAVISSEYALVYSRSLSAYIKEMIRKRVWQYLDHAILPLRNESELEVKRYQALYTELLQVIESYDHWNAFRNDWNETKSNWIEKMGTFESFLLPDWKEAPPINREDPITPAVNLQVDEQQSKAVKQTAIQEISAALQQTDEQVPGKVEPESNIDRLIPYINEAITWIEPFPILQEMKDRWQERQRQWKNKRIMIALFGAFSAGKSSFINALLGERLLPSSPHPTTASICRVLPPDHEHVHGQVCIKLKSKQQLELELQQVFTRFNWPFHHLEQGIKDGIDRFKSSSVALEKGQSEFEFLQAIAAGYGEMEAKLGKQMIVQIDELERYVAEEKTSAFVESIDVYYDSPLAKQGIVLIDTPGVNSLNARHTRVSFEYIKQADALLYVTYYNHVFSDADRQFLLQLAQVRERFELDHMFFIVNAKDLASSEDELQIVMDHVLEQLQQVDIHRPRLFALSSIQALRGKQGDGQSLNHSGIHNFETAFFSYLFGQFFTQMRQTFAKEIEQSIEALRSWFDSVKEDEEQKEQKLREQMAFADRTIARLNEQRMELAANDQEKLERETNDLIYYARQRIYYRWGDAFNHAFHPSNLSGRESRLQLWIAWQQLNANLKNDCMQELLQVSLQIEKNMSIWLQQESEAEFKVICEHVSTFPRFELDDLQFSSPPIMEDWSDREIDERWLLKHFKNPQSFFEGDGKSRMKDEMEPIVMKLIVDFMDRHMAIFSAHYRAEWLKLSNARNRVVGQSLRKHMQTLSEMKSDQAMIHSYESSYIQLQKLQSQVEAMEV